MRKIHDIFIALVAAVVLPLGFAACSSNEDNPTVGPVEPQNPTARDAVRFFLHAICTCDQDGHNFESFHWGKELYPETDPGHLYIGVDKWEEAARLFRMWQAPNVRPGLLPPSAKALVASLPDKQGTEQMKLYLKPGEQDDVVAEVTMSDNAPIKHFYKITFLKNEAWPEQAADTRASKNYTWHVGDIVKDVVITSDDNIEDKLNSKDKVLDFVCVRSSGNGIKPWFVTVTKHTDYVSGDSSTRPTYGRIRKSYYVPDLDTAEELDSIMHLNWNLIKNVWDDADCGKFFGTGDVEPWIDKCESAGYKWTHYFYYYDFSSQSNSYYNASDGSTFILQFDNYEDDEVTDGMTAWREHRDSYSSSDGHDKHGF
jgi:hypothetical protein